MDLFICFFKKNIVSPVSGPVFFILPSKVKARNRLRHYSNDFCFHLCSLSFVKLPLLPRTLTMSHASAVFPPTRIIHIDNGAGKAEELNLTDSPSVKWSLLANSRVEGRMSSETSEKPRYQDDSPQPLSSHILINQLFVHLRRNLMYLYLNYALSIRQKSAVL